jgi:hypothetical protein
VFAIGRETQFEFQGKIYILSRLERRILERFRDWIRSQIGDPFAEIKALLGAGLDADTAKELIKDAKSVKKQLDVFSIGCPLFSEYASTELGQGELLYLMLVDRHPEITREDAFQMWLAMGQAEFAKNIAAANGSPPSEPKKNVSQGPAGPWETTTSSLGTGTRSAAN